jgi:Flp pilus assembly protein TadG
MIGRMSHAMPFGRLLRATRGVAAVEFALVGSMLIGILGGLADFTLALSDRSRLATAVADGATYAFVYYQNHGMALPTAADVQAKVSNAINLTGAQVTVTAPSLSCISTNAAASPPTATLTAGQLGSACSNGSYPGTYMTITATYAYTPLMPFFSRMVSTTLLQSANVRLY